MLPQKRSHPKEEVSPVPQTCDDETVKRVLAPREMFFSIPLRSAAVQGQPIQALADPRGGHALANTRIAATATLNSLQRASLTTVLTILNDYFPDDECTQRFTRSLGDIGETNDTTLASLADTIDLGLVAFLAKGGGQQSIPDPNLIIAEAKSPSSTTAVPHKRARVSKKSGRSSRSEKIKSACAARDSDRCRLCNLQECVSAHITPFSVHGRKMVDFWTFISMFRGEQGTSPLKAAALDPDPSNSDNIMNVMQLCRNCHHFLDKSSVSLVPQIIETPTTIFPYDPRVVVQYDVVVEFPAGLQRARIPIFRDNGDLQQMRPGHVLTFRTVDPMTFPLPHPLLLQLHVLCSRMAIMRAAAGYPILLVDGSDGDTLFDPLEVCDWTEEKEWYGELGGKDEARDPELVILELDQRRFEQKQLLHKIRGRADTVRRRVV